MELMKHKEPNADRQSTDGRLIYMIKLLETGLRPSFEGVLRQHGFTAAQFTALSVLRIRPGITSSELARRSFVRAQSMAETVGHLMDRELLEREPDPAHARRLLLYTTAKGLAELAEAETSVADIERSILSDIGVEERERLMSTLRRLRQNIHQINSSSL
jgi:DNA-binding MarR family transcriptional regulator